MANAQTWEQKWGLGKRTVSYRLKGGGGSLGGERGEQRGVSKQRKRKEGVGKMARPVCECKVWVCV